jgi:hypothetical protein
MSDDKTVISGETRWQKKSRKTKLRWLDCIEKYMKSTGVKRCRNKAEDRSVSAVVVKEVLVIL